MIKYPLNTEKGIRALEADNKLVFIVDSKDKKADIKKALEEQFNVKILSVNTTKTLTGKKKAVVRLSPETPAMDVATKLGMM
jgi:ribosomal protein uL23